MTEVYHRRRWNGDGSFAALSRPPALGPRVARPHRRHVRLCGEAEVTLLELTGAFATFGNQGRTVRPRAVERVLIPRAGEAAQAIDGPAGGPGEPTLGLGVSSSLF